MRSTFTRRHCGVHLLGSFGASEATIFSKRGSPRSGSQKGISLSALMSVNMTPREFTFFKLGAHGGRVTLIFYGPFYGRARF
jgi:hypothetical protein